MNGYNNKSYVTYKVSDDLFSGYVTYKDEEYEFPVELMQKLCKELGFSYELYLTLVSINKDTATSLVNSMSSRSNHPEVILLLEDNSKSVIGYTLDMDREPILNDEFISHINRIITSSDAIEIGEIQYTEMDTTASVFIKKNDPIIIEEKYEGKDPILNPYKIGVLMINDELGTVSCRLAVYIHDQLIYLPASTYSLSTSRYKRSTSSSAEALDVLILRVIDDLRDYALEPKINDMHLRYRYNKNVVVSYEEYNTILNTMKKIPSIIEDNSFLSPLVDMYNDYERRYMNLTDKKSSYIWRCTALGDITMDMLLSKTCGILSELNAPAAECFNIRDLLGYYVTTPRIFEDIAKGSIKED